MSPTTNKNTKGEIEFKHHRVLHILPTVDPKGGGPMQGVRQYGELLPQMGHQIEVLSLDGEDERYVKEFPLKIHAIGPSKGSYRYNPRLVPWLKANAGKYDLIVINGLWQYHAFGTWRALHKMHVPYFVFTHGMLDPWFKQAYPLKHLKKWLYWPWADYRVLRDARAVLFTCEEEKRLAPKSFWLYKANPAVVSYGAATPPTEGEVLAEKFLNAFPQLRGKRILLFLSRIHEKKGCDLLISAFARVVAADPSLHILMAGPGASGLVSTLKAQAKTLGIADRITWPGMVQGDIKWGAFFASEVFVLPSHQENFGIAVAEALGCGKPVLITDKVNIWREIDADEAGFVAADTLEGTEHNLRRWLALDANGRARMVNQAKACFEKRFTTRAMAESMLKTMEAYAVMAQASLVIYAGMHARLLVHSVVSLLDWI